MAYNPPHPPERRGEVLALLRDGTLSMNAIAARLGMSPQTVRAWNRASRIRPPPAVAERATAHPDTWSVARQRAAGRLLAHVDLDAGDLAEVAGLGRGAAAVLVLACGATQASPERPGAAAPEVGPEADPETGTAPDDPDLTQLGTALRGHIARQIARFDAQLRAGDGTIDSARVLRDLGGLKRLLDELAEGLANQRAPGRIVASGEEADGEDDLPARRARLARRFDAFLRERRDGAGLPGGAPPGGPDDAGA